MANSIKILIVPGLCIKGSKTSIKLCFEDNLQHKTGSGDTIMCFSTVSNISCYEATTLLTLPF